MKPNCLSFNLTPCFSANSFSFVWQTALVMRSSTESLSALGSSPSISGCAWTPVHDHLQLTRLRKKTDGWVESLCPASATTDHHSTLMTAEAAQRTCVSPFFFHSGYLNSCWTTVWQRGGLFQRNHQNLKLQNYTFAHLEIITETLRKGKTNKTI